MPSHLPAGAPASQRQANWQAAFCAQTICPPPVDGGPVRPHLPNPAVYTDEVIDIHTGRRRAVRGNRQRDLRLAARKVGERQHHTIRIVRHSSMADGDAGDAWDPRLDGQRLRAGRKLAETGRRLRAIHIVRVERVPPGLAAVRAVVGAPLESGVQAATGSPLGHSPKRLPLLRYSATHSQPVADGPDRTNGLIAAVRTPAPDHGLLAPDHMFASYRMNRPTTRPAFAMATAVPEFCCARTTQRMRRFRFPVGV